MNLIRYFFTILVVFVILSTQSVSAWGSSQPSINNSNVNNITNTINVDVTTEVVTAVYNQIKEGVRAVGEQIKRVCEAVSTATVSCTRRFTTGRVIMGTLVGGYATGTAINMYLRSYLSYPLRWCRWNEQMSLESLFAIPQDQLGTELVKEIQRRYTNVANPVDFITPFILFMRDIEQERKALEWYIRAGVVENKLYLSRIMFYDKTMSEQCEKWLARVAYLNAVFIHWMADFKFLQNARVLSFVVSNHLLGSRRLKTRLTPLN